MRIFTLPDSFLGRAHFRLSEDRLRAPLMSHPKGAVPLGTLGTIGRELKSWGALAKLQYWITRLGSVGAVRSQQEDFGVQGALTAGHNSHPKPPGGTGSGKLWREAALLFGPAHAWL